MIIFPENRSLQGDGAYKQEPVEISCSGAAPELLSHLSLLFELISSPIFHILVSGNRYVDLSMR